MSRVSITGIDIGHHSIKAVVLKPKGDGYTLVSFHEVKLSEDIFLDGHILDQEKVLIELKALKKKLPRTGKKIALAIPDSAVISKTLQIEGEIEPSEEEFSVYQAFSHQSPFPVEELSLDFVHTDTKVAGRHTSSSYQVYATKRDLIENRIEIMQKAGFEPVLFDMQTHGLLNLWQWTSKAQSRPNWLLLDIGVTQTTLCIDFVDKAPYYKDIAFGTQQLSAGLIVRAENEPRPLIEFVERVARQVQLFTSMHGETSVGGIWLSGGGAVTDGLATELIAKLHLPCEVINPFAHFHNRSLKRKRIVSDLQRFSTAAGLALRGLNWLEVQHVA